MSIILSSNPGSVDPLTENFSQTIRDRCPIEPDLFNGAIDFIEDTGRWETYQALGWQVSRNWQTRKPHDLGILAGFRNEDGTLWQGKAEHPAIDKDGKARKYETPKGIGSRAYLPPIDPCTRQIISQRYGVEFPSDGTFWDFVESRPELTIVITEGGFKSLAALNLGYICLSLYGVNAGVLKYDMIGSERIHKLKPEVIADLQRFAIPGRRFVLAFDQDSAVKTRAKVSAAMADLSFHLGQSGCDVSIAAWDGNGGAFKGLDDLIFNAGADAWHSAFNAAIPANQWRIQNELSRAVKRKPDLHIGDREFSEVMDQLPKSGLVILHGGKGTGKSKAIGAMLENRSWLSSTTLISLGRDQAQSWDGVFLNDGDMVGDRLLRDGAPVNGATVCIPSLMKVHRVKAEILVIDEATAHLEFLLNSRLANKQGIRPLLIAEHHQKAKCADLVIVADADLSEEAIAHYEEITGHRAYLVRSDRQALPYEANILEGTQTEAIAALQQRIDTLEAGKLLYINTDSKALADALAKWLEGLGIKSLLVTSDTSGDTVQKQFLTSKGANIPELQAQGIQAIVSSPTIAQGFSIELHTNRIDSVWGFYRGGSIAAHAIAQSLDRVRSTDVPRFVNVAKKGAAYSKLSKAQTIAAFTKEFKQLSTAAARLARLALTPEAQAVSDGIDWQGSNTKMLAALEVRRNRGMMALRDTVIALLRHEGKRVGFIKPLITKAKTKAAGQALKLASDAIRQAHSEAVAQAEALTEAEYDRLSDQTETLTPEQILSLTKYRLATFYRTDVDADLVMFDRSGRTQQRIKALERVLNRQIATDRTAGTINRNSDSPQDWSRAAVLSWLHEQSGFSDLVQRIVTGEVVELTAEVTTPIVAFVRGHAEEFRIAWGFRKLDEISDQQIIGEMLRSVAIRTRRDRRRGLYSVDNTALAAVFAIIERRKQCDPPVANSGLDQTGGSTLAPQEKAILQLLNPLILTCQSIPIARLDSYGYPIDDFGIA